MVGSCIRCWIGSAGVLLPHGVTVVFCVLWDDCEDTDSTAGRFSSHQGSRNEADANA